MSSETISKAELIEHIRRAFVEPFPQGEVLYVHGIQDYIEKADWVDGPSAEASCWTKEMHEMLVGIIGKSWQELDPRKLPHGSCLTFWSARGAAYYLPSVLLACLEDIEHNNGKAGELIDYLDKYILDDLYEILDEEGKKYKTNLKGFYLMSRSVWCAIF